MTRVREWQREKLVGTRFLRERHMKVLYGKGVSRVRQCKGLEKVSSSQKEELCEASGVRTNMLVFSSPSMSACL